MKILALDQSTRTGWAFGTEVQSDRWAFGSFRLPKRDDDGERFVIFKDGIDELLARFAPDLIAFETPYFPLQGFKPKAVDEPQERMPFNPATVAYLFGIRGVLLETCARHSIPTVSFTSSTWRKTALGFGRAKGIAPAEFKRMMIQRAKALGYNVRDDNEADAIGILMHVLLGKPARDRQQGDLLEQLKGTL